MSKNASIMEDAEKLRREVEELKAKRIEEYKRLNLYSRCRLIARRMGTPHLKSHGAWWIFQDSEMEIGWDDWAPNLYVKWRDKVVLKVHLRNLDLFRPGKWLERVMELSERLIEEERLEEELRKLGELRRELEKWREVEE